MFVSPKTMALLLKLNIPQDDLLALFESLNDDAQMMQPPPPEPDAREQSKAERMLAERQEYDRERKRVRRNSTGHSAESPQDAPPPSPETKGFPEPLPKTQTLSTPHPPIVPPPHGEKPRVVARSSDFEAWYGRYPNKVGKGAAEKAFKAALQKTSLDVLMAGLELYVRTKPAEREWCNPATWLNQERWMDVPALPPKASPPKRVSWC